MSGKKNCRLISGRQGNWMINLILFLSNQLLYLFFVFSSVLLYTESSDFPDRPDFRIVHIAQILSVRLSVANFYEGHNDLTPTHFVISVALGTFEKKPWVWKIVVIRTFFSKNSTIQKKFNSTKYYSIYYLYICFLGRFFRSKFRSLHVFPSFGIEIYIYK